MLAQFSKKYIFFSEFRNVFYLIDFRIPKPHWISCHLFFVHPLKILPEIALSRWEKSCAIQLENAAASSFHFGHYFFFFNMCETFLGESTDFPNGVWTSFRPFWPAICRLRLRERNKYLWFLPWTLHTANNVLAFSIYATTVLPWWMAWISEKKNWSSMTPKTNHFINWLSNKNKLELGLQ